MLDWYHHDTLIKDAIPWDNGDEWSERCVVMQYIGMEDKRGREIYEGDFVQDKDGIYRIEWDKNYIRFICINVNDEEDVWDIQVMDPEEFEVVGNVFDGVRSNE